MRTFKRIVYIFISILLGSTMLTKVFAEDGLELKYMKKGLENNTYKFYLSDFWGDISSLKMFLNGIELSSTSKRMDNDGNIEVKNFLKSSGDISFERTISIDDSGSTQSFKSNTIKFRREDNTMFRTSPFFENRSGRDMVNIYFEKEFQNWPTNSYDNVEKSVSLIINGQEYILSKDNGTYEEGKYYYNNKYVTFLVKNLSDLLSVIKLKIDGVYSNYTTISKENYSIEDTSYKYEVSDYNNTKILKIRFNKPKWLETLNGYEVYVNDTKLDSQDSTLGSGIITISLDLLKFTKDDKTVRIYFKNTYNNYFSNTIVINIEKIIENKIQKIELGDGSENYALIKIIGSTNGFFGDINKLKLNINGQEYTKAGVQTTLVDSSGAVKTDEFGNNLYEMKNKLDFYFVGGNTLQFYFDYSKLNQGENVIFIMNDNSGRESNKVGFAKGDYSNLNYDTGAVLTNTGKENIIFENGTDITSNKIDFLNTSEGDIILGKINFNNFKDYDVYNVSFKIKTNIKTNPFSIISLGTYGFITSLENDGTTSFIYSRTSLGKDLISGNIITDLNQLFNINEGNIKLTLGDFSVKKYDRDGNVPIIFSNPNTTDINLGYAYDFSNCFDGVKDYCGIDGINDTSLTESLAFGKSISITNTTSQTEDTQNTDSQTTSSNKKNVVINTLDYKTQKFKTRNDKFIKLYDKLRTKSFTSRQLSSLKSGINNILKGLKDYEDDKKIEAISLIKTNLKSIITIIKSLKSTNQASNTTTSTSKYPGCDKDNITLSNGQVWSACNVGSSVSGTGEESYGKYYTYNEALTICPTGWKLPSEDDWTKAKALYNNRDLTNSSNLANKLVLPLAGEYDFGHVISDGVSFKGESGMYRSSTPGGLSKDNDDTWGVYFDFNGLTINDYSRTDGYSVRCIANDLTTSNNEKTKVKSSENPKRENNYTVVTTESDFSIYKNTKYNFQLDYPEKWIVGDEGSSSYVLSSNNMPVLSQIDLYDNTIKGSSDGIQIFVLDNESKQKINKSLFYTMPIEYYNNVIQAKNDITNNLNYTIIGYKYIKGKMITFDGGEITVFIELPGNIVVEIQGKAFNKEMTDDYINTFNKILSSFKLSK